MASSAPLKTADAEQGRAALSVADPVSPSSPRAAA
eukprot:CAMPEP_0176057696 /NCGR_PEP_ID=MMETSP0120_2-20121206/28738_1 /TAXON_ID=160619 /ORGANISM="Kryptoperidinium foliaceum, Strain CCMP 1326" /LENGTH=34 /DNA_ID= /DNA_START= /DNA_END= /DNA_ORIENTATION=